THASPREITAGDDTFVAITWLGLIWTRRVGSRPVTAGRAGTSENGTDVKGKQAQKNGATRRRPATKGELTVEPAVKLVGVSKSFGKTAVFKGVNFTVAPGELVEVTGPSGLLADEPLASMDEENAAIITHLLEDAAANGTTVIVASHRHTFAASRILRLPSARVMTNGARRPALNANGHANGSSNGNGN